MSKMSYEHIPPKSQYDGRLLHELLEAKAEQSPDAQAIIMYDVDLNRSVMTFAEYRDRSRCLASSLLDLGLSRGQHVLLIGQTSIPYMVCSMALNRIGCNAILLGAGGLTSDKVELLKTLNCTMIIYDPKMKESQKKQLLEGIGQLTQHNALNKIEKQILVSVSSVADELVSHSYESLLIRGQSQSLHKLNDAQSEVQFDDPMIAMFTSGSTGSPKVVQHTVHSIVNYFGNTASSTIGVTYIDRPFSWAGGYFSCQIGLSSNVTPLWVPTEIALSKTTSNAIFKIWEKEQCTMGVLNVALIHSLYTEKLHLKYNLSHLKVFVLTGQRFSLENLEQLFDLFPDAKLRNGYGSTESRKIASIVVDKENFLEGNFWKLSISSGVEVKLVDAEGKVVPRAIAGEICARSCYVFLEYLGNPEATKQAKSPTGWFHTGDIGIMYGDGKIEVLGRKTEMIKRATVKIFPAEIEKVVSQHPFVADVVVVGVPDQRLHEEMCACIVLKDTEEQSCDVEIKVRELEDWCRKQWPPGPDGLSMTPKYFLTMKSFPLTATGKVSRREIKAEAIKRLSKI